MKPVPSPFVWNSHEPTVKALKKSHDFYETVSRGTNPEPTMVLEFHCGLLELYLH
jgi:hypothetical protein